mgnify:FL=1
MSVTVFISIEVSNFDTWLEGFTSASEARSAAGLIGTAYRNINSPNTAHVIGTAPSREAIIEYFSSPELQERQKQAGVTAPPVVTFLEEA